MWVGFSNIIGGIGAGEANRIGFNGSSGGVVLGSGSIFNTNNTIRGNSIFANGDGTFKTFTYTNTTGDRMRFFQLLCP